VGEHSLILLDTHIWIWFNLAPERLPDPVALAFDEAGTEFAISSITVWETILAGQRGCIQTTLSPEETSRAWLAASPIVVIPIDEQIATLSRTLEFGHSDPADRFIAATAFSLDCMLATVDEELRRLPWLKTIC